MGLSHGDSAGHLGRRIVVETIWTTDLWSVLGALSAGWDHICIAACSGGTKDPASDPGRNAHRDCKGKARGGSRIGGFYDVSLVFAIGLRSLNCTGLHINLNQNKNRKHQEEI